MIRGRPCKYYFSLKFRNLVTTCTVPLDLPTTSSYSSASEHKTLCFSLVEQLIRLDLVLLAQQVIQRIVTQSSSISEAISVVDFAAECGLELDLATHGLLCRQLVYSKPQLAEFLYNRTFLFEGAEPDALLLDSMVICFCRLGKFEEALTHFNRLLLLNYVPSKFSLNAIFRELCAQERVLEAFDYFVRVNGADIYLGYWNFNVLMDGLCNKGYMEEALELFEIMQSTNGYPPTLHLFKTLFYGLCKIGWLVEAELLIREMEFRSLYPDKTMYTSLIHEYCKDKKMKMAMQAFFRMVKIGCKPDNYTLNTLIHGFVKLGLVEKGWLVYNLMAEWGIQPDVVTFQIMISKYCQEGKVDSALMILNSMVSSNLSPSLHCYTVLINALYRDDRLEEVGELLKSMLDNGIIPDHVLFFTLMKMYPKGYELQLALNILEAIIKNGCGCDPSVILTNTNWQTSSNLEKIEALLQEIFNSNLNLAGVAFSIVISALCETENLDCALDYLHKMVSLGCKPLLFTYNSLIRCFCKEGLFEDAMSLIDHMHDCSLFPDTTTYLIIMNEYCKQGNVKATYYILRKMKQRGLKPSVAIYDSIISCLSRKKRIFEAEGVFKMMLQAGVDPDKNFYLTMINGYGKNGRILEARELFEQMVENSIPPSSHIYTALISGLVKKNMTDKGCLYLGKMLRDGFSPNAVLYTSLINHYLKIGEVEYAFRLVDLMERSHIEPDVIFYITLVSGLCKNLSVNKKKWCMLEKENQKAKSTLFHLLQETTLVPRSSNMIVSAISMEEMKSLTLKLLQKVKDVCIMPDLHLYNSIICGYCRIDRMLDANHHLELMQKEGLRPNQVTFTILMDGHILAGDVNSAVWLFNKMNVDGCIPDKVAYNTLLKGLYQGGRLSDTLSLSYIMHKRGFSPNILAYHSLKKLFLSV